MRGSYGSTHPIAHPLRRASVFLRPCSKQDKEASAVLATSEHGLPFHLRALGFRTGNISKTIVAEEVPPAVMEALLVDSWGCGKKLAAVLLQLYGGHVLHASAAVRELATAPSPGALKGTAALGVGDASAPARCLKDSALAAAGVPAEQRAEVRQRVQDALRALVLRGYLPLAEEEDTAAEVISLANVGCVVPEGATAAGVPPEALSARMPGGKEPKALLVPASHSMRLLIASEVFPPP